MPNAISPNAIGAARAGPMAGLEGRSDEPSAPPRTAGLVSAQESRPRTATPTTAGRLSTQTASQPAVQAVQAHHVRAASTAAPASDSSASNASASQENARSAPSNASAWSGFSSATTVQALTRLLSSEANADAQEGPLPGVRAGLPAMDPGPDWEPTIGNFLAALIQNVEDIHARRGGAGAPPASQAGPGRVPDFETVQTAIGRNANAVQANAQASASSHELEEHLKQLAAQWHDMKHTGAAGAEDIAKSRLSQRLLNAPAHLIYRQSSVATTLVIELLEDSLRQPQARPAPTS